MDFKERNVKDLLAASVLDILKFRSNKKKNGAQPMIKADMTVQNWLVTLEIKLTL